MKADRLRPDSLATTSLVNTDVPLTGLKRLNRFLRSLALRALLTLLSLLSRIGLALLWLIAAVLLSVVCATILLYRWAHSSIHCLSRRPSIAVFLFVFLAVSVTWTATVFQWSTDFQLMNLFVPTDWFMGIPDLWILVSGK